MASEGHKVLSFAYKDMTEDELNQLREDIPDDESQEFREELEKELTYAFTVGMEDPIREEVKDAIENFMRPANKRDKVLNIKILTGDHIETAKKVAVDCGLITEEECSDSKIVMEAA